MILTERQTRSVCERGSFSLMRENRGTFIYAESVAIPTIKGKKGATIPKMSIFGIELCNTVIARLSRLGTLSQFSKADFMR